MNEIILAPCDVITKIKQNSSDMNEIILSPCDAGYVQSCTGLSPVRFEVSLLDKGALFLHQMALWLKVKFKVSLKVNLKANPVVSLKVELSASVTHFISAMLGSLWDSLLVSEVVGLKVRVM
jgi:hypothetical protein